MENTCGKYLWKILMENTYRNNYKNTYGKYLMKIFMENIYEKY